MSAKRVFVGLGAPAGPLWHDQMTVLDLRHVGEKLVIPRQPVDVGLHDPQIRHRRAEMGVHHGAEVAGATLTSHASAAEAIFIDCQTPFHGVSMMATSIACSRK